MRINHRTKKKGAGFLKRTASRDLSQRCRLFYVHLRFVHFFGGLKGRFSYKICYANLLTIEIALDVV